MKLTYGISRWQAVHCQNIAMGICRYRASQNDVCEVKLINLWLVIQSLVLWAQQLMEFDSPIMLVNLKLN